MRWHPKLVSKLAKTAFLPYAYPQDEIKHR
jgi:hypothetical protein